MNYPVEEKEVSDRRGRAYTVFIVPGPDLVRDKLVPMHTDGVSMMAQRFGEVPSRSSICRWRTTGYPVDRNGPRVLLPYTTRLKQVYTSANALSRWFQTIGQVGEEIRKAGGVEPWRKSRQKGK